MNVITSPRYANSQSSRHSSRKYLYQAGDYTIDNHIEAGDTLMKEEALDILALDQLSLAWLYLMES
ncbi:hypothetical protein [Bacillus sp. MUM 13]|uniref:hypothetical protein n=1 Tax=Bacillus sp. MUM 13 TaxID=1678001 RepID=UPI0011141C2B|nr:hypothetical protein [Bacillus sp. MUM 13]